jgi:hypothetical protein
MRTWWWALVLGTSVASADPSSIRLRRLTEEPPSAWLRLDTAPRDPEAPEHRELSYQLGPFRVGVSASIDHFGDSTHRSIGLFAYRTFHLSRWMHAWIGLGIGVDRWDGANQTSSTQGVTVGLTLGTTFR